MNKNMIRRTAAAAAALTLVSGASYAAEPFSLDEIVVTATRTEDNIKDVPAATEVVTQKDIQQLGAVDLPSALRLATSVNTLPAGMTGRNVSIRGMGSERTLILVDGKRLASEDTSATANVYELDRISLNNVDRIEIVRSNSSALYGSDALGGVINIITKKPAEAGMTVGANTGSHESNLYYHYDLGQQGKFNGSFDANFQKVREYTYNDSGNTPMYGPRQNFAFNGEYKLSDGRTIGMNLDYMKDHMRMDYADSRSSKDKYQNIDSTRKGASLDYHAKTEASDFIVRAYYNRLEKDNNTYNKIQFNRPTEDYHLSDFDRATYDTFVLETRDTTKLSDAHKVTVGGEYRYLKYKGTRMNDGNKGNSSSASELKNPGEQALNLAAGYVQDEWTPSDKLVVIPSLRYDHSDKFGSNWAPKVGVTYKFADNLRFKANYGRGFRAPTLSEMYMYFGGSVMSGMPGMAIIGNPDLKPEKSLGYDFALEGESGKAFGSVSYYHNDISNMIAFKMLPGFQFKYQNVDSAKVEGVETMAGYHFNDYWTIKGTWNYMNAIDEKTGERIEGNAVHYGTVQLLYNDNKQYGWSGALWYEFNNDYKSGSESYTAHLLNLSVHKTWNDHFSTFAGLDNITNKKSGEGIFLDGRLWRVGMEWKF